MNECIIDKCKNATDFFFTFDVFNEQVPVGVSRRPAHQNTYAGTIPESLSRW